MRKGITKEQVINKAIELMKDKNDIRSANIREIARELGCAHTNIYNYFPSLDDLFLEVYHRVLEIFLDTITKVILDTNDYKLRLNTVFSEIINFYMDNRGWFRLLWVEKFGENHKESIFIWSSKAVDNLVLIIEDILIKLNTGTPGREKIKSIIHTVHCYIYGEVSLYMANHSFVQYSSFIGQSSDIIQFIPEGNTVSDDQTFRTYIRDEAIKILNLYLREG